MLGNLKHQYCNVQYSTSVLCTKPVLSKIFSHAWATLASLTSFSTLVLDICDTYLMSVLTESIQMKVDISLLFLTAQLTMRLLILSLSRTHPPIPITILDNDKHSIQTYSNVIHISLKVANISRIQKLIDEKLLDSKHVLPINFFFTKK